MLKMANYATASRLFCINTPPLKPEELDALLRAIKKKLSKK